MSFGLGRGKPLDDAPGVVGISHTELPPLPDAVISDPKAGWIDPRTWFPRAAGASDHHRPLEIEIGSGKGTFLIQHAERHPESDFLGIEWAGEFYKYAADRIRRRRAGLGESTADDPSLSAAEALTAPPEHALMNVRMLHTDATEFIRWRVPDAVARVIHLYFSDPWPKTRHHRRRVVQDRFLYEVARILEMPRSAAPGAPADAFSELRIVTDHDELWRWDCVFFRDWCEDPLGMLSGMDLTEAQRDVEQHRNEARGSRELIPPSGSPKPFRLIPFATQASEHGGSAGEGELVGTNFERKYRREGRPFNAVTLRLIGRSASSAARA